MDFKKRAVLYLLRKKGKAGGVFLLITIVSSFLMSCFSLLNASGRLAKDVREAIGAAFYIRARTGAVMGEDGKTTVTQGHIRITDDEISRIMGCGNIAYCNPVNYGYAKSGQLDFIPGEKHTEDNNMGQVTALRYSALYTGFSDKTLFLAEGRHIAAEDTGAVIISSALATANALSVGDTLILSSSELGEKGGEYVDAWSGERKNTEAAIIGIYDINVWSTAAAPTAGRQENRIYASLDVLTGLGEGEQSVYTGEADFYVNDPNELGQIVSGVRQIKEIDWETHFIRTNDFGYSEIADSLLSLCSLIKLLLVCVSTVSAAVLILILTLRIRARVPEAGILLGAGIPKHDIICQFLYEVLIVTAAAFVFSYAVTLGIRSGLYEYLLAELISGVSDSAGTDDYLSLGIGQALLIYGCQLVIVTVCVLLSSSCVLRLKPREILTKLS